MAQFKCSICGEEFEQKSRYERHMMTSHPEQAPSAADIERVLKGVHYPKGKSELVDIARDQGEDEIKGILENLPDKEYRDSAEVAREFGGLRSHEEKPQDQPSRTGGQRAMQAPSAAKIASVFKGIDFPVSGEELKDYARDRAGDDEMEVIKKFAGGTYQNMADVEKEVGSVRPQ